MCSIAVLSIDCVAWCSLFHGEVVRRVIVCDRVFCQAEDGIRDLVRSRGLGDVYKRQTHARSRQVSAGIVKGVHFLMKKNKIEEINGWGMLLSLIHI